MHASDTALGTLQMVNFLCGLDADLMHVLWEADVSVFKAHITTGPSDKVLDLFWIYDNKKELPENHRLASCAQRHAQGSTQRVNMFNSLFEPNAPILMPCIFLNTNCCAASCPLLATTQQISLEHCWPSRRQMLLISHVHI